ncbi:ABC transporter substrate-binding protein [Halorubrum ezzemoulense]|uniref:ABC transporter substrate-binding protein n=2 Tax=Halorubrum ezzemoulense TaxID=337243 RepID=A0A256J7B1_HALEZ|nr:MULTISPECIES: extracellular solute-binding protein [Halorubrum]MDB2225232.1 extracellular solute-binding protein [Halorubrum ezzemoulense]MDB2241932.1 extracellular solute-binding protein [Halorubrum ezzemoulense]MDB2270877.1 extracellular solute-binding protein [Halorubrum ezzemoulense]OYR64593.1 ABC transporter substrate-binding protein [Halorubrum ezzemoulense]OYR75995.1 ABC transporter substrate-binding protein [Halorubrum ezzemoulense]
MVDTDSGSDGGRVGVSRRRFIEAAGATGATVGLAGCGGGGGSGSGPIQITMDAEWEGISDSVTQSLYDAGLDESIEVEILPGDFESGARRSEFTSALDAGRASPDIFMMDSGWTIPFIARGQLVNLSEELSSETVEYVQNSYLSSAVSTASDPSSGDLFGVPLFPDYPVIHYRRDLVEDAGYDPDAENWATEPLSWQEFAEVAADVWEQNGGPDGDQIDYGFTTQADNYVGLACCTFNETMTSFGGGYFGDHENLFGPIGDRPITVTDEPVLNTIRMMRSFMEGPDAEYAHPDFPQISTTDLLSFTEEPSREPFTSGNAIFHRNWPYAIPLNLDSDAFDAEDYDVMPLPYGVESGEGQYEGTGGPAAALGGWHLTINPNTQRLDEAVQVLEAFANEEVMVNNFSEGGYLPPDPSVTESVDPEEVGALGDFLDTLAVSGQNTVPRPVTVAWPDQGSQVASEVSAAYQGEKSPQQAMSDLESSLSSIESDLAE